MERDFKVENESDSDSEQKVTLKSEPLSPQENDTNGNHSDQNLHDNETNDESDSGNHGDNPKSDNESTDEEKEIKYERIELDELMSDSEADSHKESSVKLLLENCNNLLFNKHKVPYGYHDNNGYFSTFAVLSAISESRTAAQSLRGKKRKRNGCHGNNNIVRSISQNFRKGKSRYYKIL